MNVEKHKHHSLYSRIFIKMTVLLVLIVLLSGLSLSVYYSGFILEDYVKRDIEELIVIEQYYENFLNSVRASGSVLITDPDFQKLIFDDELLSWEISEILSKSKNLLISSPHIEFVNFYVPEKGFYYSSYSRQKETGNILDSIDPDYLTPQNIKNFNPIPMEIKLDTVNDLYSIYSEMLVFILPVSRQENSPYLAIYVDAVKFQKSFQKGLNSELIILNNNNDVICHTGRDVFGIKKEELDISDHINDIRNRSGIIHGNILKKDLKIISIINNENYTMIKDSSIMPFVKSVRVVIVNSLIVILTIILGVYYLASRIFKNLYSPIQSLLSRLHQLDRFKSEDKTDLEIINFISTEAESVSQIDSLRSFREQNMILVRNRYMDQFLNGKLILNDQSEMNDFLKKVDFPFSSDGYFKIISCSFSKNISNDYSNLLIRGLIQQYFSQNMNAITFTAENQDYITIISDNESFDDREIDINCHEFINFLKREQGHTAEKLLNISVGETCVGFFHLPENYTNVLTLNGSAYKYDNQSVITNALIKNDHLITAVYPLAFEEKTLKSIRNHNCEEAMDNINYFFETIRHFDHTSIFNFIIRFTSSLITVLQLIERKSKIDFHVHFNSWFKVIIKAENMKTVEYEIKELLNVIQLRFNYYKKSKTESYAKTIMAIVDQEYTDPNLCITQIAESINLSPAYCGQIFRKTFSMSILEYILSIRLEKAREIMTIEPDRKINDISLAVGIQNYRYFYTKFKLAYGVTPGNYRIANS